MKHLSLQAKMSSVKVPLNLQLSLSKTKKRMGRKISQGYKNIKELRDRGGRRGRIMKREKSKLKMRGRKERISGRNTDSDRKELKIMMNIKMTCLISKILIGRVFCLTMRWRSNPIRIKSFWIAKISNKYWAGT